MKKLLITEKNGLSKSILEALKGVNGYADMHSIAFNAYTSLQFNIPRHLNFSDVPFNMTPRYKLNPALFFAVEREGKARRFFSEGISQVDAINQLREYILSFDEVIFAMDADHSGQFSGFNAMSYLGIDLFSDKHRHMLISCLSEKGILKSFHASSSKETLSQVNRHVQKGMIKRYFDYNWLINSLPISQKLMKETATPERVLTKGHIQTLMLLKTIDAPIRDGKLLNEMDKAKGTGKYPAFQIGSPASSSAIVLQLIEDGLIQECKIEGRNHLYLSKQGEEILNRLHPKFKDPDLIGRLNHWMDTAVCEESVETNKQAIRRYLNKSFVRQKNFMK